MRAVSWYTIAMSLLLVVSLFLLPTYVIRFGLFGLPVNLLLLWLGCVWVVFVLWLIRNYTFKQFMLDTRSIPASLLVAIVIFFCAGTMSVFVSGITQAKIGQWLVLFLQPVSLFFIARVVGRRDPDSKKIWVRAVYWFIGLSGLFALLQYFTLIGLPHSYWGNAQEPKRAISFFEHPNGFALFITPLLAFLLPDLLVKLRDFKRFLVSMVLYGLGFIGLGLSLSRGGWVGLLVAAGVYVLAIGSRKLIAGLVVVVVVCCLFVLAVPNLRYRILLPFQGEKSTVARFSLWQTGWKEIRDNPVLGKGLTGFSSNWYRYNTDPNLDHYNFPHNVVLNFWVDTGLFGMLSFLWICGWVMFKNLRSKQVYQQGIALFVIALLIHGLIDIPYLKNDLALLFWLVIGLFA